MRSRLVRVATMFANREVPFTFVLSLQIERLMKCCIMSVLLVVLLHGPVPRNSCSVMRMASTGMPYAGNPPAHAALLSTTTGVTQGSQGLQVTVPGPGFGGPGSAAFTDAGRATTINNSPYMLIDMTVPRKRVQLR